MLTSKTNNSPKCYGQEKEEKERRRRKLVFVNAQSLAYVILAGHADIEDQ